MAAEDYYNFDYEYKPRIVNKDPKVWVTKDNRHILVDEMTESHVRNTLKLILRYAHEGKVWAISPKTGGLRHYKEEDIVAKVTVVKEVQPPVDPWAHIQQVTLHLNVEEAKAIRVLTGRVVGLTVGRKATDGIWDALDAAGVPEESDQSLVNEPAIEFRR